MSTGALEVASTGLHKPDIALKHYPSVRDDDSQPNGGPPNTECINRGLSRFPRDKLRTVHIAWLSWASVGTYGGLLEGDGWRQVV